MSFLGDWLSSRRARYQADALKAKAEQAVYERRAALARKPDKSHAELMEQRLFESGSPGLLMGWGQAQGVMRDYLGQMLDFSRGGLGVGAGLTNKTGRRGSDWPFVTSEAHLWAHLDFSRLVSTNPNVIGLIGGRRRYTLGSGATIRVEAKKEGDAKVAEAAQKVIDDTLKANRFSRRQREFFDRSSVDGEGIWRLFPEPDGTTAIRDVYSEQLHLPAGSDPEEYEYGIKCDPDDIEDVQEFAVHSLRRFDMEPDYVPPQEIIYHGPNKPAGVKRSIPDWTLGTGEIAELADDLANNMGQGSILQAAIAYIIQHNPQMPKSTITARGFADASYTKTDPYTGRDVPVKRHPPGTIVETNENSEFLASPYNAGIEAHSAVFQLLMNRVSSRWNAPKWLGTSNNDEVNFASSLTTCSPFVLTTLETQDAITDPFRTLCERVLAIAAIAGREGLPQNVLDLVDVHVTFPSPVAIDKLQEAQRNEIRLRNGVMSPQKWAEEDGEDWQKVVKDTKAAIGDGWVPPSAKTATGPGGADDKPADPAKPLSRVPSYNGTVR